MLIEQVEHTYDLSWTSTKDMEGMMDYASTLEQVLQWWLRTQLTHMARVKRINLEYCDIAQRDNPQDPDGAKITIYGECRADCYIEGRSPDSCTVRVDVNYPLDEAIDTLLHELTHAKQYFEKRLGLSRIGRHGTKGSVLNLWNGRAFSTAKMDYMLWPWEVEARTEADRLRGHCEALHELAVLQELELA